MKTKEKKVMISEKDLKQLKKNLKESNSNLKDLVKYCDDHCDSIENSQAQRDSGNIALFIHGHANEMRRKLKTLKK